MRKLKINPSLLEYSSVSLENKIISILSNRDKFLFLSDQEYIHLHLDLVMKYFARERSILASISFSKAWEVITEKLSNQKLFLSVHFMGIEEDLADVYKYLSLIEIPENWQVVIYFPIKYASSYQAILSKPRVEVGEWYNLNELKSFEIKDNINKYLLLTVEAGKSGQSKTQLSNTISREIVKQYPFKHFLLDGGWKVGSKGLPNSEIVSYGSFWNIFEK